LGLAETCKDDEGSYSHGGDTTTLTGGTDNFASNVTAVTLIPGGSTASAASARSQPRYVTPPYPTPP
jgi:hypothetical protein